MYKIKVDTDLLDGIAKEYTGISERLLYAYQTVKTTADITAEFTGFDIGIITEQLYGEAEKVKAVGEETAALRGKTERIIGIYSSAENAVEHDVGELPVLVHNNISVAGNKTDVLSSVSDSVPQNVAESSLLCDNTVMHEDWLVKLIAKNKYGE